MLNTVRARFAFSLSLFALGLLVASIALGGWLTWRALSDTRLHAREALADIDQAANRRLLTGSAGYMNTLLFPRLYALDVTALNEQMRSLAEWLPIDAFVIADNKQQIVTDGTSRNLRYGERLLLPTELVPNQPLIRERDGQRTLFFTIGYGEQLLGYAQIIISDKAGGAALAWLDRLNDRHWARADRSLLVGVLTAWLLLAAGATILALWLARVFARPVRQTALAAESFANGQLDTSLAVQGGDEIARLAAALNSMARELAVSQQRMRKLANYDALTNLPNRLLFHDRLRQALHGADRSGQQVALLFLDLDRFKEVNEALGHGVGDEVLKLVARRLEGAIRAVDTVSRRGGDEFTLVIQGLRQRDDVATVANKLLRVVAEPCPIQEHELRLSASIGIALYPQDGTIPETLLRRADSALYQAKQGGRNGYRLFEDGDEQAAAQTDRRSGIEQDLRRAVENLEFAFQYQPQLDARSGQLVGVEALLRWRNHDSVIAPGEFLPLLEDTGLITRLTDWAVTEAARALAIWRNTIEPDLRLTINLSTTQLEQSDLTAVLRRVLKNTQLPPGALEIEISEQTMLETAHRREPLERLRALGLRLAIDDFGSGYSSLVQLQRMAISILKIDRGFVADLEDNAAKANVTGAVIALAARLGIATLAKGIEEIEQWRLVRALGCDLVQGYFIARPLDGNDFLAWALQHQQHAYHPPAWQALDLDPAKLPNQS